MVDPNYALTDHLHNIWQPAVDSLDWHRHPDVYWQPHHTERLDGDWFPGASLDPLWNLLGRHQDSAAGRIAVYWEGEPGDRSTLTYGELEREVARMVTVLRDLGVGPSDAVALYTGWLPETVVFLLACIALGAEWSIVPISVHSEALAERLSLIAPKVFVTQDGAWRHGTVLPLKVRADDALGAADSVEHTIVIQRTGIKVPWFTGDHWYHELMSGRHSSSPHYAHQHHDAPDKISTIRHAADWMCTMQLATSDTPPALTKHDTAGVLVRAASFQQALTPAGPLWCAGNIAWVVSTWNGLLGPLLFGQECVLYEGTLDVPDQRRGWEILRRYAVETLVTPPSVMRTIRSWASDIAPPQRHLALAKVVTAGEAVEPELKSWLTATFAPLGAEVLDAWGQVMIGGIAHLQGGSAQLPDIGAKVVDNDSDAFLGSGTGELVLTQPLPGMVTTVEGPDADVMQANYQRRGPNTYATSDLVTVTDGILHHHGRSDSLVSMAGQLISLDAVRRVIADHPFVRKAEATTSHAANQKNIIAAVELQTTETSTSEASNELDPGPAARAPSYSVRTAKIATELIDSVQSVLGGLAKPHTIIFLDTLPDNSRNVIAHAADLLPTDVEAVHLTWQEISHHTPR